MKSKAKSLSAGLEPELAIVVDVMFPPDLLTKVLSGFKLEFPSTPPRLHLEALGAVSQTHVELTLQPRDHRHAPLSATHA